MYVHILLENKNLGNMHHKKLHVNKIIVKKFPPRKFILAAFPGAHSKAANFNLFLVKGNKIT